MICPSCGGNVQIIGDLDKTLCPYCGREQIIRQSRVEDQSAYKISSELALQRLDQEVRELEQEKAIIMATGNGCIGIIGLIFLLLLGSSCLVTLVYGAKDASLSYILTIIVFCVLLGIVGVYNQHNKESSAPIDKILRVKRAEIDKHRQIVG